MSSTLDNSTGRPPEKNDAERERWEQAFRDARPMLPEEAMARIEMSIHREMDRAVPARRHSRLYWRQGFLVAITVASMLVAIKLPGWIKQRARANHSQNTVQYQVEDHFPLSVVIGPDIVAPDRPILPLDEYPDLLGSGSAPLTQPATHQPAATLPASDEKLLEFTSRLVARMDPGEKQHGMLGQWDLRRVLEHRGPQELDTSLPRALDVQVAWNLLPLEKSTVPAFKAKNEEMRQARFFWGAVYTLCLAQQTNDTALVSQAQFGAEPKQFPGKDCDWARLDLLNQAGKLNSDAGLSVLTTRSYQPLRALAALDAWPGAEANRERLRNGYLRASHDLIEAVFSLRLAHHDDEADVLLAQARKLTYLTDPRDLAILLARFGPDEAWDRLVRPLMTNEVAFIRNAPDFSRLGQRQLPQATVSALTKSVQEGVTTYAGDVLIKAGMWRIACDKLTVFRNLDGSVLFTGDGHPKIRGVYGILSVSDDEFTFNTATGDLKLTGSVQIESIAATTKANAARITRTGEVMNVEQ